MKIISKNTTAYWGPNITESDIKLFRNNKFIDLRVKNHLVTK